MKAAGMVVCFLQAMSSCSGGRHVVGPEDAELGLEKARFCQASPMKTGKIQGFEGAGKSSIIVMDHGK